MSKENQNVASKADGRSNTGKQNRYTDEFKSNAVKMILELGLSYNQVATKLGCGDESVRRWVRIEHEKLQPQQSEEDLNVAEQLKAKNKEIARLQMELDFLKKQRRTSRKSPSEVRLYQRSYRHVAGYNDVLLT